MSDRPRGKVRGNRDSTLPIEDWAKGLSKAFARRKSVIAKSSRTTDPVLKASQPGLGISGYGENISTKRSTSFSASTQGTAPISVVNRPIEDWMKTLPQRTPGLKPRNPLRVSTHGRPSTSISSVTTSSASPKSISDSGSVPTDWGSDFERELPTLNPFYANRLDDLVNASSNIRVTARSENDDKVSPLPSSRQSKEQLDLTSATMGVRQGSLRELFFPGSTGSRERPAPLSITSSETADRRRPLSIVSSIGSFATADDGSDYAVEDNKVEENNDTGIDEDYNQKEDNEEVEETYQYKVQEQVIDQKIAQQTIFELQKVNQVSDIDQQSNHGTLEDVLIEVALSSPYASSESDVSSQAGTQEDSRAEHVQDVLNETSSDRNVSLPDTDSLSSPISISSGSIEECRRVRPARHYKMINGIIVQYDPWRVPGQYPRYFDMSDFGSSISERSLQRTSLLNSANEWSRSGMQVGITA